MPFDISSTINNIVGSGTTNKVLLSPIWSSLLITGVLVLIIYFTWSGAVKKKKVGTLVIRSGVYIFLTVATVLFLHYQMLNRQVDEMQDTLNISKTVGSAHELTNAMSSSVEVKPRINPEAKKEEDEVNLYV